MFITCHVPPARLFLLLAVILGVISGLPAMANGLEPADILIVCNSNFPGSLDIAEHYAAKRRVPKKNIVALELPDTEAIPRQVFDTAIVPVLRRSVQKLRAQGRQPILLLLYGMPLKVGAALGGITEEEKTRRAEREKDVHSLAESLAEQLAALTAPQPTTDTESEQSETPTPPQPATLQFAQTAVQKAFRYLSTQVETPPPAAILRKIHSLIYQLAGTEPFARLAAEGKNNKELVTGTDSLITLQAILTSQIARQTFLGVPAGKELETASLIRASQGLIGELAFWQDQLKRDADTMTAVAVDSELALLLRDQPYQLERWLPNPWHIQFDRMPDIATIREQTLMVARLDGPSPKHAKRLVDDALWAEEHGLTGNICIDARGLSVEEKGFYGVYDGQLRNLAAILREKSSLPVIFDEQDELFGPGDCPKTALYCGWYSLGKYIDAFDWQRGAVGFHVASVEAATLRKKNSEVWAKRMIEEGIAATLGPVQEPYLQSFPRPDLFFPLLLSGRLPLIEVYYRSIPQVSWRQVLVGDPLYTPFKNHPALAPAPLPPEPLSLEP